MSRPWHKLPINHETEPLVDLPDNFLRLEPHPYYSLGAPYGEFNTPWKLRSNVIDLLKLDQKDNEEAA